MGVDQIYVLILLSSNKILSHILFVFQVMIFLFYVSGQIDFVHTSLLTFIVPHLMLCDEVPGLEHFTISYFIF